MGIAIVGIIPIIFYLCKYVVVRFENLDTWCVNTVGGERNRINNIAVLSHNLYAGNVEAKVSGANIYLSVTIPVRRRNAKKIFSGILSSVSRNARPI